jgi:hypothetical protein
MSGASWWVFEIIQKGSLMVEMNIFTVRDLIAKQLAIQLCTMAFQKLTEEAEWTVASSRQATQNL